jgi:hypothetical protein
MISIPGVKRPMPLTTTLTLLGMVVAAGDLVIRFIGATVAWSDLSRHSSVFVPFIVVVGAVSIAIPIVGAWSLLRGARLAPFFVTLIGVWGCSELAYYWDLLAVISAGTSSVSIFAVWMPSAREFGRDTRAVTVRS